MMSYYEQKWRLLSALMVIASCPITVWGQSSTHIDAAAIRAVLSEARPNRVAIDPRYAGRTVDPVASLRDTVLQQRLEVEFGAQSLPLELVVCPGVRDARLCRLQHVDVFVVTSRPIISGSQAQIIVAVTKDAGRSNAYPEQKVWRVKLEFNGGLWTVVEYKLQSIS